MSDPLQVLIVDDELLANRIYESVEVVEAAFTEALRPYWDDPGRRAQRSGYHWGRESVSDIPTS